jgi:hypothetical protein
MAAAAVSVRKLQTAASTKERNEQQQKKMILDFLIVLQFRFESDF